MAGKAGERNVLFKMKIEPQMHANHRESTPNRDEWM
jgi:hypothetical protein